MKFTEKFIQTKLTGGIYLYSKSISTSEDIIRFNVIEDNSGIKSDSFKDKSINDKLK